MQKPTTDDIIFEARDIEIFNIPDTKTKLNTLQNYFFPRLQRLLNTALDLIREIYKVDPLEKYSFVYSPSHRKEAKFNRNRDHALIGICGRRRIGKQLKIKRPDGKFYSYHPSHAYFIVTNTGEIKVELWPFSYADSSFFWNVKTYLTEYYEDLTTLLNAGKLTYDTTSDSKLLTVKSMLKDEYFFSVTSATQYFPIEQPEAIKSLVRSFALLFPILDACHDIAEGKTPTFKIHIENLRAWAADAGKRKEKEISETTTVPNLPELDSYKFVRAGLWYQVLARDKWTCCSCKRSAKEHGIVLHVDHIKPRSLSGKDELDNLQTLCLKCNIGKSNKDDTDLRR